MTEIRNIATEDTTPDEDNVYLEGDDSSLVLPDGSLKMTIRNAVESTTFHAQAWRADHSDEIHSLLTAKAIPDDDDVAAIEDSAASWAKKRITLLGLVGTIAATKRTVRVATTANGTLATAYANGQTVDGVTLVTGDRILLKDQTTASENGIYVVAASGAPARAADMPTAFDAAGSVVVASGEGTANPLAIYICSNSLGSGIVDSDNLVFGQPTIAGIDSSVANQIAITANGESVIIDNDSATPSLRPDVDNTWTLGENALRWQAAKVNAGAAATPSLSIRSDDLGIYSPAASQLALATDGALAVKVEGTLDAATGNEVAYDFTPTINKATSGDYTALKVNVTETSAPGTANKLASFGIGGTPVFTLSSGGIVATTAAGSTSAPSVAVRDASIGMYSPASNQVGLVANGEAIIVDNDSATPSLRPDVASTWDLGELAYNYSQVYAAQYDLVTGGVNYASFAASAAPGITVSKTATLGFSIVGETQDPGVVGVKHSIYGGKAGVVSGANGVAGGRVLHKGGEGSNGDATYLAGTGGESILEGGDAGVAGAAGGRVGGNAIVRGGLGTGIYANGTVQIGVSQTEQVEIGASGKLTWIFGDVRNDGYLLQKGRISYQLAPKTESGTTRSTNGSGGGGNDDDGYTVQYSNASGCTVTVDQAYAGCRSKHVQLSGAGTVTLSAGSGVTLLFDSTTFTTAATVAAGAALYLEWLSTTLVLVEGGLTP